jgi:hypothetical protein
MQVRILQFTMQTFTDNVDKKIIFQLGIYFFGHDYEKGVMV